MSLSDTSLNNSAAVDMSEHKLSSTVQQSSAVNVEYVNTKSASCCDSISSQSCDHCITSNESSDTSLNAQRLSNDSGIMAARDRLVDVELAAERLTAMLAPDSKERCFILDIDLDFFSTTNPFLTSLTAEQFRLLSELYAYTSPLDRSVEVCFVVTSANNLPVFEFEQN